jgi:hypothetical protein
MEEELMAWPSDSGQRPQERIDFASVAVDGLFAGVLGSLVVALGFLAYDTTEGVPLHTPSVLGAHLFYGGPAVAATVTSDVRMAIAYNGVHVLSFVLCGLLASYVATLIERSPKFWYLAFIAVAFTLFAVLYLDGAFGVAGLGRFRMSVGALLGAAVLVTYLLWRHPGIAKHLNDVWQD